MKQRAQVEYLKQEYQKLNNLIEAAKADNFIDPVTKEIDIAKLLYKSCDDSSR